MPVLLSIRKMVVLLSMAALRPDSLFAEEVVVLVNPDTFEQAISEAEPGTVLLLEGGEYGVLWLTKRGGTTDHHLTLRSADRADPARFSGMHLEETHDVTLDGLFLDYSFSADDPSWFLPFSVLHSRDVVIRNTVLDGDVARGLSVEENGYGYAYGLDVEKSEDISVEGCEIREFTRGIVFHSDRGVTLRDNDLHDLRSDGMDFAQVEDVLVESNLIRGFVRSPTSGDHPDMIQFWTSGTTAPSRTIVIRNNVLIAGVGWYTQSIFMRNELVDTGEAGREMLYRDVTIEGNVIINAHQHGITVGETDGLTIANNTLIRGAGIKGTEDPSGPWTPSINVAASATDVQILRNVTPAIADYDPRPDWTVQDNFLIQNQSPLLPGYYDAVFVAARTGDQTALASFRPLPGGPLDGTGLGAPRLNNLAAPAVLTPLIRVLPDAAALNRFIFDASLSAGPKGQIGPDTTVSWVFDDGQSAKGTIARHVFATSGAHEIKLQIRQADGETASATARIVVPSPNVLSFDARSGQFTSWLDGVPGPVPDIRPGVGPLQLGGAEALVLPPRAIAGFFDARSFDLKLRIRAMGKDAAGEILRVHPSLILQVSPHGTVEVHLDTGVTPALNLSSPPLRLFSGGWHDIELGYSAQAASLIMKIDGRVVTQGRMSGAMPPQQYWGLSFGYPFEGGKSFVGELERFTLTANTDRFVRAP